MSPRFLVDTNVLSEPTRARPDVALCRRLGENVASIVTAAPVVHELRYGIERLPAGPRRDRLEELAQGYSAGIPVLPYDEAAARWHAAERARLERTHGTRPFLDGQIAAIAVVNDCVLVTRNVKDYQGYRGLKLEDWFGGD